MAHYDYIREAHRYGDEAQRRVERMERERVEKKISAKSLGIIKQGLDKLTQEALTETVLCNNVDDAAGVVELVASISEARRELDEHDCR